MDNREELDEFGFWKDEPTSRLERITQRLPKIGHRTDWSTWSGDEADEPAPAAPAAPAARSVTALPYDLFDDFDEDAGYDTDEPADLAPAGRRSLFAARSWRGPAVRRTSTSPKPAGTRSHGDTTGSIPVVAAGEQAGFHYVDPLLRRLGALAAIIALAIPVALAVRGSGDDGAATAGAAAETPAADTVGAQVPAAPAATETTYLDPKSLPPATPVPGWSDEAQAVVTTPAGAAGSSGTTPASAATTAAAPAPAAQAVTADAAPSCAKEYTVVAGDYWILIAQKVSVKTADLLAANGATTRTALYPGRTICLPANASTPTTVAQTTAAKTTATTVKPTPTTVKPTATTKPPTTTVPTRSYTKAEVEAIIRQVWPDDLEDEAVRIATRESNLVPTAKNFCCYGLFQIYFSVHKTWLASLGVTQASQLFDPRTNAYVAYAMYLKAGGWGPWKL